MQMVIFPMEGKYRDDFLRISSSSKLLKEEKLIAIQSSFNELVDILKLGLGTPEITISESDKTSFKETLDDISVI